MNTDEGSSLGWSLVPFHVRHYPSPGCNQTGTNNLLIYSRIPISVRCHASDYCTVNIHLQPSPSTRIATPTFEKVCKVELSPCVPLDYMSSTDMDMALDKIVPEDLAWLHTDEGPE